MPTRFIIMGLLGTHATPTLAQTLPPNYDFQWQTIGSPNNPAYSGPDLNNNVTGRGSVSYVYRMSKLEVTSTQWVEFANAIGAVGDPYRIGEDALGGFEGGPTGPNNTYHYNLQSGFPSIGMYPVTGISWLNAARYCNWLQNGKTNSIAALQSGAYDLRSYEANPTTANAGAIQRAPDAQFWIPSLDEWLKAAHFDPNGNGIGQSRWWQYSITSDTAPVTGRSPLWGGAGQTNAGLWRLDPSAPYQSSLLGQYPAAQSPWGLLDTSGGASELLETPGILGPHFRLYDGSGLYEDSNRDSLDRVFGFGDASISGASSNIGLRIASAVPCQPTSVAIGLAMCASLSRRRK